MKTSRTFWVWSLVLAGTAFACFCIWQSRSQNPRLEYAYILDFPPKWRLTVRLNGQPVNTFEHNSGIADVSLFVVDGSNELAIDAEPLDKDSFNWQFHFGRTKNLRSSDQSETLFSRDLSLEEAPIHATFQFRASMPCRWTWQDADEISELSKEDRDGIRKLIGHTANVFRMKSIDSLTRLHEENVNFGPDQFPLLSGQAPPPILQEQETVKRVFDYPDYTVTTVPSERIRFDVGSRIVRVWADGQEWVIRAGKPPDYKSISGEWCYNLGASRYYAIKLHGKWRLVNY